MDQETKLAEQIKDYADVAKENPNVDMGLLLSSALQNQNQPVVSSKVRKWAYLVSVALPPFGLLFALKYFFSDESDARQVAWTCVILTAVGIAGLWIGAKLIFSGSGTSVQQIQQIKPNDIIQLTQ